MPKNITYSNSISVEDAVEMFKAAMKVITDMTNYINNLYSSNYYGEKQ